MKEECRDYTINDLRNMKLHEDFRLSDYTNVMRVPGGWIYTDITRHLDGHVISSTFVPEPQAQEGGE